ncbi:uncharacterized protein ACNS7B_021652 isoform 1-T1 [Menidia menidia]
MSSKREREQKRRLQHFLNDLALVGSLQGFKYFQPWLRGKEELLLTVVNEDSGWRSPGFAVSRASSCSSSSCSSSSSSSSEASPSGGGVPGGGGPPRPGGGASGASGVPGSNAPQDGVRSPQSSWKRRRQPGASPPSVPQRGRNGRPGGPLHPVPAGRIRPVRAALRLDPLQPRAPGDHRGGGLPGPGHAHEAALRIGLADPGGPGLGRGGRAGVSVHRAPPLQPLRPGHAIPEGAPPPGAPPGDRGPAQLPGDVPGLREPGRAALRQSGGGGEAPQASACRGPAGDSEAEGGPAGPPDPPGGDPQNQGTGGPL